MAQIIRLDEAFARKRLLASGILDAGIPRPIVSVPEEAPVREGVFRVVLLLDLAVQHLRLLVRQVSDPTLRVGLEAQIEKISLSTHATREMALKNLSPSPPARARDGNE